MAVAAALSAAVVAGSYGGDGRLWRRRKEQCYVNYRTAAPPVKPQRRKDCLRRREDQTAHYGLRKVLHYTASKATLLASYMRALGHSAQLGRKLSYEQNRSMRTTVHPTLGKTSLMSLKHLLSLIL